MPDEPGPEPDRVTLAADLGPGFRRDDDDAAPHRRAREDRPEPGGRAGRALSEAHRLADQVTELPESGGRLPPPADNSVTILLDEKGERSARSTLAETPRALARRRPARGALPDRRRRRLRDEDRAAADLLLAFGKATWPHLLARAMLAEQLWRATSILANHPYHREG